MKKDWRQLLDKRNFDLWKFVLKHYKINLKKSHESNYITRYIDDKVTIFINEENIHPAPFTHELLHIFLKVKKLLIAFDLKTKISEYPQLYFLFSNSLKNHIGNCLEHEKIFPLFLERGFKAENFVVDFEERIMDEKKLKELQQDFLKNNIYSRKAIDIYLGKYFSMKSTSNEKYDYHHYFAELKNLDSSLFEVLEEFWKNWSHFEIESVYGYEFFLDAFLQKLDIWMEQKTII